jgi:hypothetical protein
VEVQDLVAEGTSGPVEVQAKSGSGWFIRKCRYNQSWFIRSAGSSGVGTSGSAEALDQAKHQIGGASGTSGPRKRRIVKCWIKRNIWISGSAGSSERGTSGPAEVLDREHQDQRKCRTAVPFRNIRIKRKRINQVVLTEHLIKWKCSAGSAEHQDHGASGIDRGSAGSVEVLDQVEHQDLKRRVIMVLTEHLTAEVQDQWKLSGTSGSRKCGSASKSTDRAEVLDHGTSGSSGSDQVC